MFNELNAKLQANFNRLQSSRRLYNVAIDRDKIVQLYLDGFSEELRQEHTCNCCKSFLRQFGGIVTIDNNFHLESIWDDLGEIPSEYIKSIKNIRQYIHSLPISSVFYNTFSKCGTEKNIDINRGTIWNHFFINLDRKFVTSVNDLGEKRNTVNTSKTVFERALKEITTNSLDVTIDLIAQNSLYRGNEFKANIVKFKKLQEQYKKLRSDEAKSNFCWTAAVIENQAVLKIKNSAIGTLLEDISNGLELDDAVTKYEKVVAPTNYKRPTALITPVMINATKKKLEELCLTDNLDRRYANLTDINAELLLFTDKSSQARDIFGDMSKDSIIDVSKLTKVEEISIRDFIGNILPNSKSIELLVENRHFNNFVSLLTSVEKECKLFKWDNSFSWSYTGGITDSIKEKVKQAGGRVDGELRASLSWHNYDDLDLHCVEPNGNTIYFRSKISSSSGKLDVDMNAGGGTTRTPVENIIWTNAHTMKEGLYTVKVHNFSKRETNYTGYELEIECNGQTYNFSSNKNPVAQSFGLSIPFTWSRKDGIKFNDKNIASTTISKDKWGVKSNTFVKVKQCMLSPNYWGGQVGNKHYMFILDNCASDEEPRAFFNEFLRNDLDSHRKVLEVLASKVKIDHTDNQLSGLGFSDTQRNSFIVRVTGAFSRVLKVNI